MTKNTKLVLGGFLLSFAGGATYSWGVFTVPLMELFGWNKYEANLSFTVFMLVFAFFMLPAGMLVDRFGYRRIARSGALLFLPAYLLASLIELTGHNWWLPATHGLLGGIGCACVYSVIAPAIRSHFTRNSTLALSTAVMGFGLVSVFLAPVKSRLLIPSLGIPGTLVVVGIAVFAVSFAASFLLPESSASGSTAGEKTSHIIRNTLHDSRFYFVWIVFSLSVVGGFLSMGLFPSYARLKIGVDAGTAASVLALFSAVNGFGRPIAGFLAEKTGIAAVLLVSGIVQVLFLLLLGFLPPSLPLLFAVSAVTGWSFAVILGLYPSFTASVIGNTNLGTRYGMVFTGFGMGALALLGGSMLYDMAGSFQPAFLGAAAATSLSVIFLYVLLHAQKRRAAD